MQFVDARVIIMRVGKFGTAAIAIQLPSFFPVACPTHIIWHQEEECNLSSLHQQPASKGGPDGNGISSPQLQDWFNSVRFSLSPKHFYSIPWKWWRRWRWWRDDGEEEDAVASPLLLCKILIIILRRMVPYYRKTWCPRKTVSKECEKEIMPKLSYGLYLFWIRQFSRVQQELSNHLMVAVRCCPMWRYNILTLHQKWPTYWGKIM